MEDQIKDLTEKLATSEQNVKDFEQLALTWKANYLKMEHKLKVKIVELEQTIEELRKEKLQGKRALMKGSYD